MCGSGRGGAITQGQLDQQTLGLVPARLGCEGRDECIAQLLHGISRRRHEELPQRVIGSVHRPRETAWQLGHPPDQMRVWPDG